MLQTNTDLHKSEQEQRLSLLTVGLAGIIARVAGVTVLALSDKEIRKKVVKRTNEVRNALRKWSKETLQLLDYHEQKNERTEDVIEDVSLQHEEKLHN